MKELRQVQIKLMWQFSIPILICLVVILLYENPFLMVGSYADSKSSEFVFASVMELVTIGVIPLALYLFKIKTINASLTAEGDQRERALLRWGSIRLAMLTVPMMVNTVLYYLYMNVAFGYMAIILFLSLIFIVPTLSRCADEICMNSNPPASEK